jgi:hypothetical protein
MAINEFAAYCIIVIFWVFIVFPAVLSSPSDYAYKDMCILSVKINLIGAALTSVSFAVVWAFNTILS